MLGFTHVVVGPIVASVLSLGKYLVLCVSRPASLSHAGGPWDVSSLGPLQIELLEQVRLVALGHMLLLLSGKHLGVAWLDCTFGMRWSF